MASVYRQSSYDVEKGYDNIVEQNLRTGFVNKVLGLLSAQLILTTVIASSIVFTSSLKSFVLLNSWLVPLSALLSIGIILTFSFSETARYKHPNNLILLFLFTAVEGILVGAASAQVSIQTFVLAFGLTAAITTGLTFYALRAKEDFTMKGGFLYSCLLSLIFCSFVGIFFRTPIFDIVISGIGAVLFSAYIVYDVQMLLGGQRKFKISTDEYVFGAVAVYLDIINLFIHILQILNSSSGRE
eukprot:CAMPEP_0175041872 /NCGR_PEP_ID=MMETSP0052_2-20121109/2191_1 /TAXON_ID=51329 ORGANISM="Polytomella parva, Strain SAG 63-3" /NCGR_SAMPLE_ID=MMETSP0052_2 /ASSEMBLY_ACC=CAM_ASM_000194 /LENGTH=241 /DNA_ID=CAMNT_0016304505 /DNA_START=50 /DNA_END=775 /DNA_ORIENTATION=+